MTGQVWGAHGVDRKGRAGMAQRCASGHRDPTHPQYITENIYYSSLKLCDEARKESAPKYEKMVKIRELVVDNDEHGWSPYRALAELMLINNDGNARVSSRVYR